MSAQQKKPTAVDSFRLPEICAAITGGIAVLALTGWQMNARFLAGQWGDYIPMAPSTALAFLLLGGALFSCARWPGQRVSRNFALAAVSIVFLLGLLVLAQFITGLDLGAEQVLSHTNELLGSTPLGRMSPLTAISFLLESAALFILINAQRWRNASTAAVLHAIVATAINLIVLTGYAYGSPLLYGGPTIPTAFPTAAAFALVGIGLIRMAVRDAPALRAWSRASLRGRLLRTILPPVLLVLLSEGWLEVHLEPILRANRALWHSLSALTIGVLILAVIGWIARRTADTLEQAQTALSNSEARYRRLFETAIDGILILDAETGMVVDANPFMIERLGFSHEEFLGKRIWELGFLKDTLANRDKFTELQQKGYTRYEDLPLETADGRRIEFEFVSNVYQVGHQKMIQCNIRDITERKRAEEVLRISEERFKTMFVQAPLGIASIDSLTGHIYEVNPRFAEIAGRSMEEMANVDWIQITHPDDVQADLDNMALLNTGKINGFQMEKRYLHPDGTAVWINMTIAPLKVEDKAHPRHLCMIEDITERKQAEEELAQALNERQAIFETVPDVIYMLDLNGNLVKWNSRAERVTGFSPEELMNKLALDLFPEEEQAGVAEAIWKAFETGFAEVEAHLLRKDGTRLPYHFTGAPLKDAQGNVNGLTGVGRDITERKQAEEQIRRSAARAEALVRTAARLNTNLEFDSVLNSVCEEAARALGVPIVTASLVDETQNSLFLRASFGLTPALHQRIQAVSRTVLDEYNPAASSVVVTPDVQALTNLPNADIYAEMNLRTTASVNMLRRGQLIGRLNIGTLGEMRHFTDDELALLRGLAHQAAQALANAQLYTERVQAEEALRQRLAELEALHTVSSALRTAQTRDEALPSLLDKTLGVLETDSGAIWLYHPEHDELRAAIARGWFHQLTEAPMKPGEGVAGTVFASGQAHVSAEFRNDPVARATTREQSPAGTGGACVPIRSGAITVGVLFVSVPSARQITTGQVRLLESLAEMAGAALHRMRLYEETVRQLNQLQALHNIDLVITGSFGLRLVLNVVLEQTTTQLQVDAASVLLLNPHPQTLTYAAGRGFRTDTLQHTRLRLGEGYAGRAALERNLIHIPDLRGRKTDFLRSPYFSAEGFVAYYAVPLIAKGEVKGVLEVFHRAPLASGPDWVSFLETLAGQAAIAIDNAQLFDNLQRSNVELSLAYDATIAGWSHALDLRDKETEGHTLRVTEITMRLAQAMDIGEAELVHIRRGALLHDIGKMGVPDSILLKPGPLTDDEWVLMRQHPQQAHDMLSPINYLRPALDIPYCHHEKWDGTGYPRGLKGEQIPLAARLFAVVDVWDALRSDRPYRAAWPEEKVREYFREQAGKHFDPQVVDEFLNIMMSEGT